jgi:hypothetical protein
MNSHSMPLRKMLTGVRIGGWRPGPRRMLLLDYDSPSSAIRDVGPRRRFIHRKNLGRAAELLCLGRRQFQM